MSETQSQERPGHKIQQERSRKTYDAFVDAGFKLLENCEFESITIAGLAETAGYSVGAFYARFKSKDEFFEAMVARHLRDRSVERQEVLATASRETLVPSIVESIVQYYWRRRRFWRAVLMRSAHDPEFFAPISANAKEFVTLVIERIEKDVQRSLTPSEQENIRFALHMVLGMVNNRIVNRPNPSLIGHSTFVENLTRACLLVSGYDELETTPVTSASH